MPCAGGGIQKGYLYQCSVVCLKNERSVRKVTPMRKPAFILAKTFSHMYPAAHKQSMVTGTQGPSALLLPHPWSIVFPKGVSPPVICISASSKDEGTSRRCIHRIGHMICCRGGGEISHPHFPQVAKLPNYLHRKSDCYIVVSEKDYTFIKLASG